MELAQPREFPNADRGKNDPNGFFALQPSQRANGSEPFLLSKNRLVYEARQPISIATNRNFERIKPRERTITIGPSLPYNESNAAVPNPTKPLQSMHFLLNMGANQYIEPWNSFLLFDIVSTVVSPARNPRNLLALKPNRLWTDLIESVTWRHKEGALLTPLNSDPFDIVADFKLRTETSSDWRRGPGSAAGYYLAEPRQPAESGLTLTVYNEDVDWFASRATFNAGTNRWTQNSPPVVNPALVIDGQVLTIGTTMLMVNSSDYRQNGNWQLMTEPDASTAWVFQKVTITNNLRIILIDTGTRYGGNTYDMPYNGTVGLTDILRLRYRSEIIPDTGLIDPVLRPSMRPMRVAIPLKFLLETFSTNRLIPGLLASGSTLSIDFTNELVSCLTVPSKALPLKDDPFEATLTLSNASLLLSLVELPRGVTNQINEASTQALTGLRQPGCNTNVTNLGALQTILPLIDQGMRVASVGASSVTSAAALVVQKRVGNFTQRSEALYLDTYPSSSTRPNSNFMRAQYRVGSTHTPNIPLTNNIAKEIQFLRHIAFLQATGGQSAGLTATAAWPEVPINAADERRFNPLVIPMMRNRLLPSCGIATSPERPLTLFTFLDSLWINSDNTNLVQITNYDEYVFFSGDRVMIKA